MDGFEVIYSKYSPLVFRYLLSLGVDFLSAEELTAEPFIERIPISTNIRERAKLKPGSVQSQKMSIVRIVKEEKRQPLRKK